MNVEKLYRKLLYWRIRYLSNRHFILIASVLVGVVGGLAAVAMKTAVHYVKYLLTLGVSIQYHNSLFFIYPMMGILLVVFYKKTVLKHYASHGIDDLLYTISRKSSRIERYETYANIITASLTVGFGGSVGLEAPIVMTGAAIGTNIGDAFHLNYKRRTLQLACGVAAGIGGIFNAPIAGIVFSLEVLMLEFNVAALIPVLIAAVTGTIVSKTMMGEQILFNIARPETFFLAEIPFYIILGVFTGSVSVYFLKMNEKVKHYVSRITNHYQRAIWGGLFLGILIFIFPPLYGEGYANIKHLLAGNTASLLEENFIFKDIHNNWFILAFTAGMILLKVVASAATIGSGGAGGIFAPSLVTGGLCGFFVGRLINSIDILPHVSEVNFILVGMAGIMSGVMRAPLTALFLLAEITSGYSLMLPLMLVSAISFATASYFFPHSVYLQRLTSKGHVPSSDKDRTVLNLMKLHKLLEKDLISVNVHGKLKDMIEAISGSRRNIFPVLDEKGHLEGIIHLDDIRDIIFKPEFYETTTIRSLMHPPKAFLKFDESMEEVMAKFDQTGDWNLPVIDDEGRFAGIVSKSKIFSEYRGLLKKQAKEDSSIME